MRSLLSRFGLAVMLGLGAGAVERADAGVVVNFSGTVDHVTAINVSPSFNVTVGERFNGTLFFDQTTQDSSTRPTTGLYINAIFRMEVTTAGGFTSRLTPESYAYDDPENSIAVSDGKSDGILADLSSSAMTAIPGGTNYKQETLQINISGNDSSAIGSTALSELLTLNLARFDSPRFIFDVVDRDHVSYSTYNMHQSFSGTIDTWQVVAVPEPSPLVMGVVSFVLGSGAWWLRRRHAAV